MASMMAKVKMTMMASCKVKGHKQRHCFGRLDGILQWPSWWSTVMAMTREDTVMGVAMM